MDKIINDKINVLSLFDGISCGQIALERVGIKVNKYYASEIDKYSIEVTQHNYPNTIQLGNVLDINTRNLPQINLIMGGSPCQGFSFAGKQLNFNDPRSKLFFEYVRVLNEVKDKNPNVYFLLENVKMKKESEAVITEILGVEPIEINSALVSAQNRKRLYWTNIPNIKQPKDKNILIRDILENNGDFEFVHDNIYKNGKRRGISWQYDGSGRGHNSQSFRAYFLDGKIACLSHSAPQGAKILTSQGVRKTTRIEHERLQTVPDNYTSVIDINKAKSVLGNGWTIDVIAHIFSFLPYKFKNNG